MRIWHALFGSTFFAFLCVGAMAQESPEATYARLHSAMLAGNADAVMAYVAASTRAELAAKPQTERESMIRTLAQVAPKTYLITEKIEAPDGNSVDLRGTGVSESQGRAEVYLLATFRKEGEAWKALAWSWSNQKPPPVAKPAAVAAKEAANEEPAPNVQTVRRLPGIVAPAKAAEPAAPAAARTPAAAPKRPSRAHLDARECLKLPTGKAIMACAEEYR